MPSFRQPVRRRKRAPLNIRTDQGRTGGKKSSRGCTRKFGNLAEAGSPGKGHVDRKRRRFCSKHGTGSDPLRRSYNSSIKLLRRLIGGASIANVLSRSDSFSGGKFRSVADLATPGARFGAVRIRVPPGKPGHAHVGHGTAATSSRR